VLRSLVSDTVGAARAWDSADTGVMVAVAIGTFLVVVLVGLTRAGVFRVRVSSSVGDDLGLPTRRGESPCVTEDELWGKHLDRYKRDHDELCRERLVSIRESVARIDAATADIPRLAGSLETLLQTLPDLVGVRHGNAPDSSGRSGTPGKRGGG